MGKKSKKEKNTDYNQKFFKQTQCPSPDQLLGFLAEKAEIALTKAGFISAETPFVVWSSVSGMEPKMLDAHDYGQQQEEEKFFLWWVDHIVDEFTYMIYNHENKNGKIAGDEAVARFTKFVK